MNLFRGTCGFPIRIHCLICKFSSNSFWKTVIRFTPLRNIHIGQPSYGCILLEMPPKLSAEQIDTKLADIRDHVRADLPNLVARSTPTMKAAFGAKRDRLNLTDQTETAFYWFLYKYEARFTEAQRNYADETFALLTQYRQSNVVHTRAETDSGAVSSNGLQRDRSRSVRRRTALGTVTNCGAPQPAELTRRRVSTKRPAPIGDDVLSTGPGQSIHAFGSGGAHSDPISVPDLDAGILQDVKKLGRHPLEHADDRDERILARKIRRHYDKLVPDTISYLKLLTYKWINDVVEAQEQLRGYRRRLTKESSARLRELRRRLELMSQVQPHHVLKKEKLDNSKVSNWWSAAGICEQTMIPKWCISNATKSSDTRTKIALWEFHYHLSHQLLRDVGAFWDGGAHPVGQGYSASRLYSDFFASCRSAERRILEPFPERLDAQCRSGSFAPHYCLRQLALIEFPNKTFKDIPSACKTCPCVAGHNLFSARFHLGLIPSKRF